ncbi:MAG: DNA polymerase III subunit delta [Ruminococcaceae bacterium]|nr:DNA polymerase III subunit delta [Oscillospiraceae bacterium]
MALNILKEADFRKELKAAATGGYLFFGEEDYMKSASIRMARQSVAEADPTMAAFDDIRLDGLDFTPAALLDAMSVPPMGGSRKVITITGMNFNALRAADLDKLCEALAEIPSYPYNLVIFSAAADALDGGNLPKKPSELLTTLGEYLRPVYFERNTPAKLAGWVQKHYLHNGVQADPSVCQFTVEYCGRNMFTLSGEIDKVSFYVRAKGRDTATEADIRTAAIPAMEYDAFAFTNAIMERRRGDALDILADLKLRRVEPLYILSEVSRVVCDLMAIRTMADGGHTSAEIGSSLKMHEYRVGLYMKQARKADLALLRGAVTACQAADRALKRSAGDGYGIIERLICTL